MVLAGGSAFMPVYIEKSGDLVRCYHSGTDKRTNDRTREDRATQPMDSWKAESRSCDVRAVSHSWNGIVRQV